MEVNGYVYRDRWPAFNLVLDEEKLLLANRQHDAAAHTVSMDLKAHYRNVPANYTIRAIWPVQNGN